MKGTILSFVFAIIATDLCAQTIHLKGNVKDPNDHPVAGASIIQKGTHRGTQTDSLGNFQLEASAGSELTITAVGYMDTTVLAKAEAFTVALRPKAGQLQQATVTAPTNTAAKSAAQHMNEQSVGYQMSSFRDEQNLFSGQTINEYMVPNGKGYTLVHDLTSSPNSTINTGSSIPVFTYKEDTKGSRYLLADWSAGAALDTAGNLYQSERFRYNYDKIDHQLLLTEDRNQMVEIDNQVLRAFSLKTDQGGIDFVYVPVIQKNSLLQKLAGGPGKYSLYKFVSAKFMKANHVSTGLTESGNNYDEYVDQSKYYLLYADGKTVVPLEIRIKSIKNAAAAIPGGKGTTFLKQHQDDPVDEALASGMVRSLNE